MLLTHAFPPAPYCFRNTGTRVLHGNDDRPHGEAIESDSEDLEGIGATLVYI